MDKFYELVTGNKQSFKQLCETLPLVIDDIMQIMQAKHSENTVLEELTNLSPNLLKSIYLLSFKKYEGFDGFNIT